jgi:hypothetical protein
MKWPGLAQNVEFLLFMFHFSSIRDPTCGVIISTRTTKTRLIDSLKIQEEEVLTLLSGSENNSISNIKFPYILPLSSKNKQISIIKGFRERA